jgi:transmembrane sensor
MPDHHDVHAEPPADWEALARLLAGESDPTDAARVNADVDAVPARRALVSALDAVLRLPAAGAVSDAEVEMALARVLQRANTALTLSVPATRRFAQFNGGWRSGVVRAAALVLVVAGAATAWRAAHVPGAPMSDRVATTSPLPASRYATAPGVLDSLRLPDGTRVVLGPASELTVGAGYGVADRLVTLRGTAMFDVVHDAAHPFSVAVGRVMLRDVGTIFTVRAITADSNQLSVREGAVAVVPAGGREVVLHRGDAVALGSGTTIVVSRPSSLDDEIGWLHGKRILRDASIPETALALRQWYGIALVVADPALAALKVTADFSDAAAADVAPVLGALLGGQARLSGDTLRIDPLVRGSSQR